MELRQQIGARFRWAGSPSGGLQQQLLLSVGFRDLGEKRIGRNKMLLQIGSLTPDRMPLLSDLPYTTNPSAKCGCNLPAVSKALGLAPLPISSQTEKQGGGLRRFHALPGRAVPAEPGLPRCCSERPDPAYLTGAPT